ncbi:MAG: response regulator [Bacteroidales bacterium]
MNTNNKTILIIEDSETYLQILSNFLEQAGYNTLKARNGIEGIELYGKYFPDMIITDIIMPKKEGIETIMEIRELDPYIKIIAISGGGDIGPKTYLNTALFLGADAIAEKPIDYLDFMKTIQFLFSKEKNNLQEFSKVEI